MSVAEQLLVGVELMFLGMGIVFGFLTLLVFTLKGMSLLATRISDRSSAVAASVPLVATAQADQSQLVAVISAAIARYRAGRTH